MSNNQEAYNTCMNELCNVSSKFRVANNTVLRNNLNIQPVLISKELRDFLEVAGNDQLVVNRKMIIELLFKYVDKHELQRIIDVEHIYFDETMKKLFLKDTMTFVEILNSLKGHTKSYKPVFDKIAVGS